jgi:hypothetical protein
MKKRKSHGLCIPTENIEEARDILKKLVRDGIIEFEPHKETVPESIMKSGKYTQRGRICDYVKQAQAYLSARGDSDVTDEDFFEMIKEDAEYLSHRFAIEKIKRWQREALHDSNKKAQDNLLHIGETLAKIRSRRPRLSETQIVAKRYEVQKILKNAKISKIRSEGERSIRLKELFGDTPIDIIKKNPKKTLDRCTNEDLGDLITAALCGVSPSTVETYRKKKVRRITSGAATPAFILKKVE